MEFLATMMVLFAAIAIITFAVAARNRGNIKAFFTTVGLLAASVSLTSTALYAVMVSLASVQA